MEREIRMKTSASFRSIAFCGVLTLAGCASAPTGPKLGEMVLPPPPQNKAMLIVYRDYAEPTALAAKVDVDGTQVLSIPQKAFAYAAVEPGKHAFALRWPAASGTPGWESEAEWLADHTYFYQLQGSAGHGFYFKSSLEPVDGGLARVTMNDCCRLITEQKAAATLANISPGKQATPRGVKLSNVREGMLSDEVIAGIGAPDHVSNASTGKMAIPFYFGSDTRRISWSYTGVGFVVFSRNEYTGTLRVVETKEDVKAP
jgi:hypothetical protein